MRTFNLSPKDETNNLAYDIGIIGLQRIDMLLQNQDIKYDPVLIVCPDASPSRNAYRCTSGFITGAKYIWGDGDIELLPIGFNANGCGFTIYGFDTLPDDTVLFQKLERIKQQRVKIDNVPIEIDLNKSNHFLGIFEVKSLDSDYSFSHKYISLVHCSAPEFKSHSKFGFGLDYNHSTTLKQNARILETSKGSIHYVEGNFARDYFKLYKYSEWFATEKRKKISEEILSNCDFIDDRMHLGYDTMNSCVLGNQVSVGKSSIVPFLTGPNSNSYFIHPTFEKSSYLESFLSENNILKDSLIAKNIAEIIPHSAGYKLNYLKETFCDIESQSSQLQIHIETTIGNKMILKNASDVPYSYKGNDVLGWCEQRGIFKKTHELIPKICLRF